MNQIVELPPAPLRTTATEGELAGAEAVAHRMDGMVIRGALEELTQESGGVRLREIPGGNSTRIAFQDLRYVQFADKLPVAGDYYALGEAVTPAAAGNGQTFEIQFADGRHLNGRTMGSFVDGLGLHLFQLSGKHQVQRLFVPGQVVEDYRIGPRLGEALVEKGEAEAEAINSAAERQLQQRGKQLGEYLRQHAVVNADQLHQALDDQSKPSSTAQPHRAHKKIGELLVDEGIITAQQLRDAIDAQRAERNRKIGDILIDMQAVSSEVVHFTLAEKLGLPFVRLREFDQDPAVLETVPSDMARKYHVVPVSRYRDRLVVAMSDPTSSETIDMLRFITGRNLEVAVATKEDIEWAIDRYYGSRESEQAVEELEIDKQAVNDASRERERREAERLGKEKPVVRLVNQIISDAIRRKASDIHIRPAEDDVSLLFRIDGSLVQVRRFSKALLPAVVSRIKIIGRMDIAERRLPQDGRASVAEKDAVVDLRISVIPTVEGESVVIRILNTAVGLKSIGELGFGERDQEEFTHLLHKSYGMLLVTGPTGSGKSTTLYAALQEVQAQNVNIITVEDPVEYHISGLEQIQVHPGTGYTFARALRHIVRHDPDVIMVGEIRDQETAKMAIESGLTGHLVLSTLHTNDAASTVTRLLEMGVEPYLLSATLLGVLAQRLVRRNCPHCMQQEKAEEATREALGVAGDEVFYKGMGCEYCNQTGYSGRLAVYELLVATEALRKSIVDGVSSDEIHRLAVEEGMVGLTENALDRARQGMTSLAEVYRVRLI